MELGWDEHHPNLPRGHRGSAGTGFLSGIVVPGCLRCLWVQDQPSQIHVGKLGFFFFSTGVPGLRPLDPRPHPGSIPIPAGSRAQFQPGGAGSDPPRAGMSPEPGEIRVHGFFGGLAAGRAACPAVLKLFLFGGGSCRRAPFTAAFPRQKLSFSEHSFPSPGPEPSASLTSARLCDAPAGILRSWFFSLP